MSFTNKTPNYNLPQWLGTDKPSWLVDVNGAFSTIDTAIKAAADSGSGADATAKAALETAQTAQETANGAVEQADNANTKADAANVTAGNAQTAAGTALTNANTALGLAQGVVKCYSKTDPMTADMLGAGLTIGTPTALNRRVLFYYPGLKLMQISYIIPATGTPTDSSPNAIMPNRNDYKIIKLPFNCTGNATINGCTYFIGTNTDGISVVRYSWLTIKSSSGSAWVHVSDSIIPAIPTNPGAQIQNIMWVNTNNLGKITLDGWQEIN